MMTPPSSWHPDGRLEPYSNDGDSFLTDFFGIALLPITLLWELLKCFFGIDDSGPNEMGRGISLFVFGYKGAGKSTFLEKIGAKVHTAGIGTSQDPYPAFSMKLGERDILIEKGEDIGGNSIYLANGVLEDMLKKKDKIIYIFSAEEFLNIRNHRCRGEVYSRLETLYKSKDYRSKIFIIASRLDKCRGNKFTVANEIRNQLVDKSYRNILNDSFGVYNLTNNDDIELIKEMIFK